MISARRPRSLRTEGLDDLDKVPLIPSEFFKDCPPGKDFALWLGNVYTGELPRIKVSGRSPSHDQVIDSFNSAGMAVCYSSGTGGRHTFMPRDMRCFLTNEYAMAKGVISMFFPPLEPANARLSFATPPLQDQPLRWAPRDRLLRHHA